MAIGSYTASLTISAKTAIIDGFGATLNAAAGARAFEVNDGARLRIVGLSIVDLNSSGNSGIAIACEVANGGAPTPTVELDQVNVDSIGSPFFSNPCSATISRSRLHCRNPATAVFFGSPPTIATIDRTLLDGGDGVQSLGPGSVAHITNSIIANQSGVDGAGLGGSYQGSLPGSMFISFSTVVNSVFKCASGTPVCAGGTAAGACIDNSIIFDTVGGAPANTITGTSCLASYTLVAPQSAALIGNNNKLGVNPLLVDPASGNYHLVPSSPAVDAADPAVPGTADFDGLTRPQGTRSDFGAFEYKP